ncbi:MAG: hypothetical protein OIF40_07610 [Mangrovicoccus sp.]|nr:hypothetical protein [Mangrovicoccus sp.]
MGSTIILVLYALFAAGFWGALRLVPGQVGRKTFFFGVLSVTLVGWFVMADTATTLGGLGASFWIGVAVAVVSGFLTGALSGGFARWLNRSTRFAWAALVPFALPVMALMEPLPENNAA